ncbi:hypothetical protein L5I01_17470 [Gordonia sp. HY442]|uniref:hypothetical protein n=1 Tax=Gordonia zhenghanii TaxID=2911516 RepID=UPI001F4144E0|nr:hypothetical protein [Gordonia zhenghanii]MCF8605147.1 hypothetical protein [Gordonia zhenghanii]
MAELDEYTFEVGGIEHTARFDEKDAKRYGATKASAKAAPKAANKARTVKNKAVSVDDAD